MGTKSKNLIKIVAFIVLFVSFGMMTLSLLRMDEGNIFRNRNNEYSYQLTHAYEELAFLLQMRDEEYISSGKYLDSKLEGEFYGGAGLRIGEKEREIKQQLANFKHYAESIKTLTAKGIYYYAQDGQNVLTNMDKAPNDNDFEVYLSYSVGSGTSVGSMPAVMNAYPSMTAGDRIFVAYDNDFINQATEDDEARRAEASREFQNFILFCLLGLLSVGVLIWLCGGSLKIDKMWNELILFLIFLDISTYILFLVEGSRFISMLESWHMAGLAGALCLIGTGLLLMFVRNIKNGRIIKGTLIYAMWMWLGKLLKAMMKMAPLNIKLCVAVLLGMIITSITGAIFIHKGSGFAFFMLFVEAGLVIWLIQKHIMRPYDDEVKTRLEKEIEDRMKSERLKTELITNVSHDLKTPLTSILNYSDLSLKKNPKDEYAKIINDKAQQLKALTEDLFDVSKAQSGNIEVNLETLDLEELINQTLAELDEHNIDFKINLKEKAIMADGALMSRVFGNLIGNIVKYSLPKTRAYIESFEQNGKVHIAFKNIANYEMNFNSDEIAERFKRGDSARATEGNGLGLAIAKSYIEACNGRLELQVDGDLFKATAIM